MKHCIHQAADDGENVVCKSPKILHNGLLPISFCHNECPYRKTPDFFTMTSDLLIKKQTSGEYKPVPKGCGGCEQTKKRVGPALQFIWPYWHGGAMSDEIRWSVRSVESFYDGEVQCTIIGDKPPWFTGHYIPKDRVAANTPNRAFRDMLSKMWVMATHAEVQSEFVWMMDDIYFIKPFTKKELLVPRAFPWHESQGNSWQRRKSNSMAALQTRGLPTNDFATHAPHHCEKAKLKALFEQYDLHNNTLLWEVLYGNTYRAPPIHPSPWFGRITKPMGPDHIRNLAEPATVINNVSSAFNKPLRDFLEALLPEPTNSEGAYVAPVKFKSVRKVRRKVKRRR